MSADASFTTGEMDVSEYSWSGSSYTTIEENWWVKYGRFVEFQLIFTSGNAIGKGNGVAKGLPEPAMHGTMACLGSIAKVRVDGGTYVSDRYGTLKTNTPIASGVRTVLHGVYVAAE